jgi:hypothetical protein
MHSDSISSISSIRHPTSHDLLDSVQPGPVHSDLIIHLIGLARDPLDVLVLCVHLLPHGLTELVQALSRTTKRIYRQTS